MLSRRHLTAATASALLAVGGIVVPSLTAPAVAAPGPKPAATPALPVPRATVQPLQSVGGPRLAATGLVTDLPPGVPAPPELRDVAWLLADLDTGEVLAAKAPHARLLPASTLKTLTALTLIPQVPPDELVKATPADAAADGTRVGMVPGQTYTGRQLFQALLMSSGNDAAYALAEAAGGREKVLAEMNANAAHLGALDTLAKDPAGLDAPGQTSSAYDLALIARAALQLPDFRAYVTTKQSDFPGLVDPRTKKRKTYKINNHNALLYNYPGTIGVKNGYTVAAHRTYISAVTRGGHTYLLTEMYGLGNSWRPQAAMYDWAFRYAAQARPVGRLVDPGEVTGPLGAPPTAVAGAPGDAGESPAQRTAAAAAVPSAQLGSASSMAPWLGFGGLAALVGAVAGLRLRARRAVRGRHRALS
ncbi:D-alanyl-D-alanine carboxypeptidase family protein [Pedococcus sp. NPDC057267]|uniref:D-alanyl-D-alanine carboxypeptidase family protein n=1 Tax=Pedococcus sp. NPDC057267 TaxID=3346077 RepID=UPI00362DA404